MKKYYAGIGSRRTPKRILDLMTQIASRLEVLGYTLRSGGADGADSAFAEGTTVKDIFIPWNNFSGLTTWQSKGNVRIIIGASEETMKFTEQFHPAWDKCSQGAKKLHSRNVCQVKYENILSEFVICYTPNGDSSGGTGQAIRMSKNLGVPILDLGNYEQLSDKEILDIIDEFVGNI